jgi:hypothetical protein
VSASTIALQFSRKNQYMIQYDYKICFEMRPLGRPRSRWKDSINMDLREIGWGGMDWICLAKDGPVEGSCEHSNEPWGP